MSTAEEQLEQIRKANEISRESNQAVIEGHLQASAVVVGQLAALRAQQGLASPDFSSASTSGILP